MTHHFELQEDLDCEFDICERIQGLVEINPWAWQSVGAVVGLLGGVLTPVIGSLFIALTWFIHSERAVSSLDDLSIVSFVLTIPLLTFGAHCLDLLERKTTRVFKLAEQQPEELASASSGPDGQQGQRRRLKLTGMSAAVALLFVLPASGQAQQTIFNVPSTDVLDKGKVYGELDVTFKPNNDLNNVVPRFSSFVPRVVVGTGGRVELGLNIAGNINPGTDSTTLVPAIKYQAYDGGDNGWAIVLGDNLFIPARNQSYDLGNYVYAQASKTLKSKTRVTFGGYHFSENVVAAGAQRAGGQFGIEQPITSTLGVAADWYTGKHAAGYFTPGFNFKPHPKVTGYVGYSIGNTGASSGNHFIYTAVGVNFN